MLRISSPAVEGIFQAAKWLKIQALVDEGELALLFEALGSFEIYSLSGAHPLESFPMPKEAYLETYRSWIESLKAGLVPESPRGMNASMWTSSPDSLWLQEIPGLRYVARPSSPFLQVQVHQMGYSNVDNIFRPMSLGRDGIFWGLQFSFPQVFQHPERGFLDPKEFPDQEFFQKVRKWSRDCTMATPMMVDGIRHNIPIRLGKGCFAWINRHPQLKAKGLSVLEIG